MVQQGLRPRQSRPFVSCSMSASSFFELDSTSSTMHAALVGERFLEINALQLAHGNLAHLAHSQTDLQKAGSFCSVAPHTKNTLAVGNRLQYLRANEARNRCSCRTLTGPTLRTCHASLGRGSAAAESATLEAVSRAARLPAPPLRARGRTATRRSLRGCWNPQSQWASPPFCASRVPIEEPSSLILLCAPHPQCFRKFNNDILLGCGRPCFLSENPGNTRCLLGRSRARLVFQKILKTLSVPLLQDFPRIFRHSLGVEGCDLGKIPCKSACFRKI